MWSQLGNGELRGAEGCGKGGVLELGRFGAFDSVAQDLVVIERQPGMPGTHIAMAMAQADVATSYVLNASKLRQQEQLSEQLQEGAGHPGRHRAGQGDHRPAARRPGRSGLPTDAPSRPQEQHQPAGGR
jgi:hypothetical protein